MRVKNIQQVNEAVFILRHFIDLSAKLLPILFKLDQRISPLGAEIKDKEKIMTVFRNYHFDTNTSMLFLESNILDLIKLSYLNYVNEDPKSTKEQCLADFLKEYSRLKENWRMIENN